MELQFRFTLSNPIVGTQVISEPIGWQNIEITLERHPEYHSLIETIDVPLELYGSDGVKDGGYDFFKACITYGVDQEIGIRIEIKEGDSAYEDLFVGQLQTHLYKDFPYLKKLQVPVVRNNLWSKFLSRKDFPVDLQGTTSIDGETVPLRSPNTISLPTQIIQQRYRGRPEEGPVLITGNIYAIFDLDIVELSEIKTKFNYPRISSTTRPAPLWDVDFGGEYSFDLLATITSDGGNNQVTNMNLYFQINDDAPVAASVLQQGVNGVNGTTKFTYSATHTLQKHDQIRFYFLNGSGGANDFILLATEGADFTELTVVGNTIDATSTAQAYLAHDAGLSIIEKICNAITGFYSEYFGGASTDLTYPENGCGYPHTLLKGRHVRGINTPFFMSFEEWWKGLNPIFGLGLGYENVDGSPESEVIRVEKIESFYDDSSNTVELENVDGELIEFSVDDDIIFKKVKAGYAKWEAEAGSGIDNTQTVHDYTSKMRVVGEPKELLSTFYAAALGIEQARRNRVLSGDDYRLDEDWMIIQMNPASVNNPKTYDDADFNNIKAGGGRYNIRLDPFMSVYRWLPFLDIGLFASGMEGYQFAGGEGNTSMEFAEGTSNDCERDFNSDDDIEASNPLHSGIIASFTHPLTFTQYKAIIADKKKSIGFSYVDKNGETIHYDAFIKKLVYAINGAKAKFELWLVDPTDPIEIEFTVAQGINIPATYQMDMDYVAGGSISSDTLSVPDVTTHTNQLTGADVNSRVRKTDNGGIAEGRVLIGWFIDGIQIGLPDVVQKGNIVDVTKLLSGYTGSLGAYVQEDAVYDLEAEIILNDTSSTIDYSVIFANLDTTSPRQIDLSAAAAGTDSGAEVLPSLISPDVLVSVEKTSNGGLAEEQCTITWLVDGVPFGSPEVIDAGDPVDTSRNITGLAGGELLRVEISEEPAPLDDYTITSALAEAVSGTPTWEAHFAGDFHTLVGSTSDGPDSKPSPSGSFSIAAAAKKTTNGGLAQDAGNVLFNHNGVTMDTQVFAITDDVSNLTYTFLGVAPGDNLDIIITEG